MKNLICCFVLILYFSNCTEKNEHVNVVDNRLPEEISVSDRDGACDQQGCYCGEGYCTLRILAWVETSSASYFLCGPGVCLNGCTSCTSCGSSTSGKSFTGCQCFCVLFGSESLRCYTLTNTNNFAITVRVDCLEGGLSTDSHIVVLQANEVLTFTLNDDCEVSMSGSDG